MHLLRIILIYFMIIMTFLFSCKSEGPLSPEEAFYSLKSACLRSDAGSIENLLSARSREKIKAIIGIISSMNEPQLTALDEKFSTQVNILRNLSIKDYLSIQLSQGMRAGEDTLTEIAKYKIIGTDIKDNTAVVRIENGMELCFVKEGPYWKFDMEELSSKN